MRELNAQEVENVSGGEISGYEGAGAALTVLAAGAAISTAPISLPVITIAVGAAGGLAGAQFLADFMQN